MASLQLSPEDVSADLRRLAEEYPAMSELIELYRGIEEMQAGFVGVAPIPPAISAQQRAGLDAGQPLLRFDDLGLERVAFEAWIGEMGQYLEQAEIGDRPAGNAEPLMPDAVQPLALARAGFDGRSGPADPPFAGSLDGLAIGQVLAGVLKGRAQALRGAFDAAGWQRGTCPVCGGWPDLGMISTENETRTLVCGRCDATWPYRRVGCPFCGQDDQVQRFSSPDNRFSLFHCGHCGVYLKHARWPASDLPRSLLGLRLLTVGLDLDAQAQGWSRLPAP